jgi:hypothetical protein
MDDLDSVLRMLLQLSAYHIEVLPLSSGKSGSVSGEVSRSSFYVRHVLQQPRVYRSRCTQALRSLARRGVSYRAATRYSIV